MQKLLVSACLLGEKVRYDGGDCYQQGLLEQWQREGRVIPLCPEVSGGLPIPRPPAEIQPDGRVINFKQEDVTAAFKEGAKRALELCKTHDIHIAILKEGSPSCGSTKINDGSFSKTKVPGRGVVTEALENHGVRVFSEGALEDAVHYLNKLEKR